MFIPRLCINAKSRSSPENSISDELRIRKIFSLFKNRVDAVSMQVKRSFIDDDGINRDPLSYLYCLMSCQDNRV